MALGTLSLTVTQGVQGHPFQSKINGLTTGVLEVRQDGGPGFSTVNGNVMSGGLPYEVSTLVLREYEPGVGQGYRDTRIEIQAATRASLYAQAVASLSGGRSLVRWRVAGERQPDGSILYKVYAEDDLGATVQSNVGAGAGLPGAPTLVVTPGNTQNSIDFIDGSTGGSVITSRKVYRSTTSGFSPSAGNLLVDTPTFPFVDSSRVNGTPYYYRGITTNATGDSPPSAEYVGIPTVGPITISGAPGAGTAGIAYSYIPTTTGGSGTKSFALTAGSLSGSGLSFNSTNGAITGSTPVQGDYSGLEITVTDSSGSDKLSNLVISIAAAATAPLAPTGTATPGNGKNTVTVTPGGNGGSAITGYKIYASTTSGFTPGAGNLVYSGALPTYEHTAANGTPVYYRFRAVNAVGDGALSVAEVSATPSAGATSIMLSRNTVPAGAAAGYSVGQLTGIPAGVTPTVAANNHGLVIGGNEAVGWELISSIVAPIAGSQPVAITAGSAGTLNTPVIGTTYTPAQINYLQPGAGVVYSLVRVSGYSGNSVDLYRVSDGATQSFGWDANNMPDAAAINAFSVQGGVLGEVRVAKLYDQSGNLRHGFQTDPTKMPLWVPNDIYTGLLPMIMFDAWYAPHAFLNVPMTGWNAQNFVQLLGFAHAGADVNWIVGKKADGSTGFKLAAGTTSGIIIGTNVQTTPYPRNNPQVIGLSLSTGTAASGTRKVYMNELETVASSPSSAVTIASMTIGDETNGFRGDLYFFALYPDTNMLNTVMNPMLAGIRDTFKFVTAFDKRIIMGGDSIEAGLAVDKARTTHREMVRMGYQPLTVEWINIAVAGQTIPTAASIAYNRYYRSDIPTYYTTNIGQNSLSSTVSGSDSIYSGSYNTVVQGMLGAGAGAKAMVFTVIPNRVGDGFAQFTARQRENADGATAVLDLTLALVIGDPANKTNPLYYYQGTSAPGIHPTALGNTIKARHVSKAIDLLVAGSTGLVVFDLSAIYTAPSSTAVGAAASGGVTASGGKPGYSYSVYSGALPTGSNINSTTGAFTGTFTAAGTFTFFIQVTDATNRYITTLQRTITIS